MRFKSWRKLKVGDVTANIPHRQLSTTKGIAFTSVFTSVILFILLGPHFIGFFEDLLYVVACRICPESRNQIYDDVGSIVTAGQSDVKKGVEGFKDLENDLTITDPNIKRGLIEYYQTKILVGSLLTLGYIFLIYLFFEKVIWSITGYDPTPLLTILFALVIVGIIHMVFTGFKDFPYSGWIALAQNPIVFNSNDIVNAISPIPLNVTSYQQYPIK